MRIAAIWRYPVKSMAGERVASAAMDQAGIAGDRLVQVYDGDGRMATARRFPRLLGLHATLGADGEPLVDGVRWDSAPVGERVEAAVGRGARLRRFDGATRFDVLPLLVCTDGAVALFGRDVRRLRPNVLIEGVGGNVDHEWAGAMLRAPGAEIHLADVRARCVMTTYDPDTTEQDPEILRDIVRRFGGRLCLNAAVARPGRIRAGDPVEITLARRTEND
jgi:uncharacterized protein YcbX